MSAIAAAFLFAKVVEAADARHFDGSLIDRVRAASHMVPGRAPFEIRFQPFAYYSGPMSLWVEDAPGNVVSGVIGVFQIRYSDGWIIVDSGAERELISWEVTYADQQYALVGAALRDANLIVATHEHADHIGGIISGRWAAEAGRRAMLTARQLHGLETEPDHQGIQTSPERAKAYLSVDYNELVPISPGVVLIEAPGHSAGSQFVYVRLEEGTELLLVGDAVWVEAALDTGSQKPSETSSRIGEDRDALALQIRWLTRMREAGLKIVVAHDAYALDQLVAAGVIKHGIYLRSD